MEQTSKTSTFSWTKTIETNIQLLRICGLWPPTKNGYQLTRYTFYAIFINVGFVFSLNVFESINLYYIRDDPLLMIAQIICQINVIMTIIKAAFFVKNIKLIAELVGRMDVEPMFQPNRTQLPLADVIFWQSLYKIYAAAVVATLTLWSVVPLFSRAQPLPMVAWYPYDVTSAPNYQITYLFQVASIWAIGAANGNIDMLVFALLTFIGVQIDTLCLNLGEEAPGTDFGARLRLNIAHHRKIVAFGRDLVDCTESIIFAQFFVSIVSMAFVMFHITQVEVFGADFIIDLMFFGAINMEIFFYCYFGNQITFKSNLLVYNLFKSDWICATKEIRKSVAFFMTHLQKPMVITSKSLINLSINTYMQIMQTAFSYFSVLRAINNA